MAKKVVTRKEQLRSAVVCLISCGLAVLVMTYFFNGWSLFGLPKWVMFLGITAIISVPVYYASKLVTDQLFVKKR